MIRVLSAFDGARIRRGIVEERPPAKSLTAALRRAAHVNLDDPKHEKDKSDPPRPAPTRRHELSVLRNGRRGGFELPLDYPDGVRSIRVRLEGTNAHGERWQRERSIHVLVHP